MHFLQTSSFAKNYKKLKPTQRQEVDEAIHIIARKPEIGELKRGDLSGVRVYKFHMQKQTALLGYQYNEEQETILLMAIGSHENFYRDMKR